MENIIIGGVSLEVLKKQQTEIRKDASKVIAEHLAAGTAIVEQIVAEPDEDSEDKLDYEALAAQALEHMQVVELVAGISGVEFFLPFYEEYGRYDSDEILSQRLEGSGHLSDAWEGSLDKLYSLVESMESDSRNWHSSMC